MRREEEGTQILSQKLRIFEIAVSAKFEKTLELTLIIVFTDTTLPTCGKSTSFFPCTCSNSNSLDTLPSSGFFAA